MSRRRVTCLAALVGVAACGRLKPLTSDGFSGADQGSATYDAGAAEAIVQDGKATDDATVVAPIDALSVADAVTDGGRVPYHAIAVATGEAHTCALLDDHRVKCWGNNDLGQLGYGDNRTRGASPDDMGDALPTVDLGTGRTALSIAASRLTTCAILDDGSMKCWGGAGLSGQPRVNGVASSIGDDPGEMGDNLPPLDFGGRKAIHVGMGETVACASMDDDTIWCWAVDLVDGKPQQGDQLPAKRAVALGPSGGGVIALFDDGTLSVQLPNEDGFVGTTPMFASQHKAVAFAGGWQDATCVLFDDATTACDRSGTQSNGPVDVVAIGIPRVGSLCAALTDGDVRCQGLRCGSPYQCSSDGSFTFGASAVAVTSNGSGFACAVLADGNLKCWSESYPTDPRLGSEFDVLSTHNDGGINYGPWHAVNLGTH